MLQRVFCAVLLTSLCAFGIAAPTPAVGAQDTTELISKGWSKAELLRILGDFESMYRDRLGSHFGYRITPISPDEFDVHFPTGIQHPLFAYLVNYVQYPKGLDYTARQIAVLGRVTLTAAYPVPNRDYIGVRARIYVPSDDRDFDLVYVAADSEFFRQSFTFDKWERQSDGRVPLAVKALW